MPWAGAMDGGVAETAATAIEESPDFDLLQDGTAKDGLPVRPWFAP